MLHRVPPTRIALAQVNTTVGDFAGNAAKIREATGIARGAGATLVVFPELALSGYPPRDLLDMPEFLARAARTLAELAAPSEWSRGIALVIGFPEADHDAPPPGVYNAAALVEDGEVRAVGRKSLLPTYDVFDEARYFLPAERATSARSPAVGLRLGLSICEDIWNDKRFWQKPRYQRDPIGELSTDGADLVLNISASPYGLGKPALRERMVGAAAARQRIPIAYVNQVGGNDALVFDGGSMLVGRDGRILARGPLFEEAVVVAGADGDSPVVLRFAGAPALPPGSGDDADADEVYRALGHPLCDLAAQNVQARIRGQLLMAISNEEGSLCLSTGNKSELAVGYCTLYGDMAGGLAVIGDLPKTLVYRVARAANARAGRELVPESTFTKPPSAELKPDQTDQDTLPPYAELDDILADYIEERLPLEAIAARGHAPETVRRVLRMVVGSEYKRRQAAPVLKVISKAFGEGRRLPIAHGWRY